MFNGNLKKFSHALLLTGLLGNVAGVVAYGQAQQPVPPDCVIPFFFTVTANVVNAPTTFPQTQGFYNGTAGCTTWNIEYGQVGLSALSLLVQSAAPATTGVPGTPGTYGNYAGTVSSGVNPNTSTTPAQTFFTNGVIGIIWIQVTLSSATGTGSIEGKLLGWNAGHSGSAAGSGGSGCVGTLATPCQVQPVGNGTVISNQQAVTGSAVALATNTARNICVKALIGNTINVYVGPSGITTGTGFELAPDETVCLPVSNTNLAFVIASTTGASVSWIATN